MNPWLRRALLAAIGVELALLVAQQYLAAQRTGAPEPTRAHHEEPQGIEAVSLTAFPDRIADAAGVLGGFRQTIEWQGQSWRDDLGIEIHVVTLRSRTKKIEKLANEIFQRRRIGEGAPSGGVLVLLNSLRGEARIEVSYSLEHVFPDLIVGRIARDQLAPYAAYRVAGMAVMDVLHLLKDYAYLQAVRGALELPSAYRERPEFVEKARYLSGGAGARATLAMAEQEDRDFKAPIPAERRSRYAPSGKPLESAEAYLRTQTDQVGDPTLDLYTPGSRCMLESYPYAPFEQLERLQRAKASKPLRVRVQDDHAVVDSNRPAHGFVPILLERRDGRWRIDLVETWKNLFFDSKGDYHQKNNNHPYAFALDRFGAGSRYGMEPWQLVTGHLVKVQRVLAQRGRAFDEYLIAELLYRNCWLPIDALSHYERAIELSPHNLLFNETLAYRAAYVEFWDLAVSAYAELGTAGLLWLANAQRAAGDGDAAIASARRALDRDPYWIEAHDLLRVLLEAKGDQSAARAEQARADAIRSDPRRPGAALTMAFDPPYPVLHSDAPTKVGDTDVYDHGYFAATLTNPSGRDVEIESAILISDGTADRSGLGDIKDYWRYPSGSHRLRAGESVTLARTWGFTVKTGHQQLRYAFDVCWKTDDGSQCRDYRVDLFPPFDDIGIVNPSAVAAAKIPEDDDGVKRAPPAIAARIELLALLRGRRFDELTRRVEAAQSAFEADPSREEQVAQIWDTFATADPSLAALLGAWAEASDSYAPIVALGIHHRRSSWAIYEARGVPARVSREQAKPHVDEARRQLRRALEMHPHLAIAFEHLINLGKFDRALAESRQLADEAARVCPSCIGPSFEHLFALTPRWGGSYEQMDQYLADLAPRIAKFPRLAVVRGALAWDRAASGSFGKDHEAALRSYDEALRHGDYWQYRRFRGDTMYWLGQFEDALADHEYWIAHGTRGGAALLAKTYDLGKLHRYAEAAETIELARRLEPTDEEIVRLATWYRGER